MSQMGEGDPDHLEEMERDLSPLSPEGDAISRQIDRLEPCHEHYVENVKAILTMIGYVAPGGILSCGQACASRKKQVESYGRALAIWRDSDALPDYADAPTCEIFELLGDRTDQKSPLVGHVIAKLDDNAYKVYDDEDEDFDTIESRIQHLAVCNYDWRANLRIVLLEIAAGERLFDWHVVGGFNAHGDCPDRVDTLKDVMESAASWSEDDAGAAGRWGEILGEPTDEKRRLLGLLCRRVAEQHEKHDSGGTLAHIH